MVDDGGVKKGDIVEENEEVEEVAVVKPIRVRRYGRRAGDKQQQVSSTWLISFTDVMALMLTFLCCYFLCLVLIKKNGKCWQKNFKRI